MNKAQLHRQIIQQLSEDLQVAESVLAATHEAATHSESKAENKYDTRGLEAAYLADGQRRRLMEIQVALKQFKTLDLAAPITKVRVGALIEVSQGNDTKWLLLGPNAAGLKVHHQNQTVLVISPQSPLGSVLMGKEQGDEVVVKTMCYEVLSVL